MDRERDRRPPVEVRARLRVGVPADARVAGTFARARVLVHDAEAVLLEQPRVGADQRAAPSSTTTGCITAARARAETGVISQT